MLAVPLLAVVYEVRLEAEVGLRHSPINRRFNERKVGARTTTNFQDLVKKKIVIRLFGTPQDFHKSEEKFSKKFLNPPPKNFPLPFYPPPRFLARLMYHDCELTLSFLDFGFDASSLSLAKSSFFSCLNSGPLAMLVKTAAKILLL
jgi:hypothetical protein